ncbi:hypothetical protein [Nitratiruptor sp. YY09-18]|uniref:hypothetical protein n=1 Tax=Nitratiruptor sp. YY09-18 TaxID=2724901 RepID=UPI0019164576|nr:hypothetical protein [Nitratiruptor sp. YY09-18]BCD67918.1 hypothetical protein NitYY0918_C0825 [Nitratiruptor sp. YY09-18]
MIRLILVLIVIFLELRAYEYNDFLLHTQISIYPKLLAFDKNLGKNIKDEKIDFYIIYASIDELVAQKLQSAISQKFDAIHGYPLQVHLLKVNEALADKRLYEYVDAIYLLKIDEAKAKELAMKIAKHNVYSFVYDKKDLLYGYLFAIAIERSVTIYINKKVLQQNDFDFITALFENSKIVAP